jgi:spore germination cell wall hydrolase CwlJ-like protein
MKPEHVPIFKRLQDWQLFGLCIEREASGEPYEGQVAVGTVILERVDHRDWDGKTIHEVIMRPWQFSWTMPEAGADYYNEAIMIVRSWPAEYRRRNALRDCCAIAKGLLLGSIPRDQELAAAHCCQYLNPKLAADTRAKWLASGMTTIKKIGNHEFFAS